MKLLYREIGEGETIIILHGLYGSSDNWVSIAKHLGENYKVFSLDQRNHGQSPHSEEHNYSVLTKDLLEFFEDHQIKSAVLLGHSMGGKVAMQFAIDHPEKIASLIVVDIAPWSHLNAASSQIIDEHRQIIKGLHSISIDSITSRTEADNQLSEWVKNESVRQFLLKNLKRNNDNTFSWRFSLAALASNIDLLVGAITPLNKNQSNIRTLFIKGEKSNYISEEKFEEIKKTFPAAKLVIIKDAGTLGTC